MQTRLLELPYPPATANRAVRHTRSGSHYVPVSVVKYRSKVAALARLQGLHGARLPGPLVVTLLVAPPDRRRVDADNLGKACLDACTKAGVWVDDGNDVIVELTVRWAPPQPPHGAVLVQIEERPATGGGASRGQPNSTPPHPSLRTPPLGLQTRPPKISQK